MAGLLENYIQDTASVTDVSDLMGVFEDTVRQFGFDISCYLIVRKGLQSVSLQQGLVYHSFPPDWVDHYVEQGYFEIDPIINQAPLQHDPYFWSDIERLVTLTDRQKQMMREFGEFGIPDGVSIPIFTAKGNIAYFGLGTKKRKSDFARETITELRYICDHTHATYRRLGGPDRPETVVLSPREKEVLYWIAQGKSNSVIATILEISDHTVDTLVRRCFSKLGVTNRVSAALKGVCAGLVTAGQDLGS